MAVNLNDGTSPNLEQSNTNNIIKLTLDDSLGDSNNKNEEEKTKTPKNKCKNNDNKIQISIDEDKEEEGSKKLKQKSAKKKKMLSNSKSKKKNRMMIDPEEDLTVTHPKKLYSEEEKIKNNIASAVYFNYTLLCNRNELSNHFLKRKVKQTYEREDKSQIFFNVPFFPKEDMFNRHELLNPRQVNNIIQKQTNNTYINRPGNGYMINQKVPPNQIQQINYNKNTNSNQNNIQNSTNVLSTQQQAQQEKEKKLKNLADNYNKDKETLRKKMGDEIFKRMEQLLLKKKLITLDNNDSGVNNMKVDDNDKKDESNNKSDNVDNNNNK